MLVGMYLLISKSKFGRWAQATGGNMQAAFSSGVNVNMVRAVAFILMGVFCAVVSLIFCARLWRRFPFLRNFLWPEIYYLRGSRRHDLYR